MQQVFIDSNIKGDTFLIEGKDAHHLINVVRIQIGEKIRVSTNSNSYLCVIKKIDKASLGVSVIDELPSSELNNKVYLFQAIPKKDRMETIIEKCVELGVYEIIPVEMKNCIVKLDDKKKKSKVERYNGISKAAAEQSKRSIIPLVKDVMSFKEAVKYASMCDIKIFPYECKDGMDETYRVLDRIKTGDSIAIFIGPEGGFDEKEVELVKDSMDIISLGRRILRTDTAAICSLSMVMLKSEGLN